VKLRRWRPVVRPHAGRRLPRVFRTRRVGRLAAAFPGGLRDPDFARLLHLIDESPVHSGNRATLLARGDQAFAAMERAIAGARREVLLESYIFKDDSAGRAVLGSLAAAAERGVEVRVLADAVGSAGTKREFWRLLRRSGVEARLFNPLFPYLWYGPFRDHRKILVVDRQRAFTGGMNIGEEYGGSARSSAGAAAATWRDTHVCVEGPAAWEMAVVFAEGWAHAGGTPLELLPLEAPQSAEGTRALVLDSRPGRGYAESASVLAAIVGGARHRVWLTNAYFAPAAAALDVLAAAARRGVDVRLLLQGRSDAPLVRHAGHGCYRRLLRRGVRIFEYQPAVLHAKTLVADAYVSVIGSSNLDFRSFQFNGECNLVLFDGTLGAEMEETFAADLEQAAEIRLPAWRARGQLHRLGDRLARLLSPLL
jgi:cardiolipin synthase